MESLIVIGGCVFVAGSVVVSCLFSSPLRKYKKRQK